MCIRDSQTADHRGQCRAYRACQCCGAAAAGSRRCGGNLLRKAAYRQFCQFHVSHLSFHPNQMIFHDLLAAVIIFKLQIEFRAVKQRFRRRQPDHLGADDPVSYTHLDVYKRQLLGGVQHYCTGPRTHVRSTGRIIGFRLLDHFIYDHFHKTYMLVGCVGDDSEENIRKLEKIHG